MLNFSEFDFIKEAKDNKSTAHFYDLDDVLMTSGEHMRVHVLNHAGQRVRSLSSKEYNDHVLPKNHRYDYSEFASSRLFGETAKPIKRMMNSLKLSQKNKDHVAIVTARGDMDNQERFAHHLNKYGIDIDKDVHVHRVGDLKGNVSDLKAKTIQNEIHKHGFDRVNFYDDNYGNIDKFLKLKKQNPNVELCAHHVLHDHMTGKTEIKRYNAE